MQDERPSVTALLCSCWSAGQAAYQMSTPYSSHGTGKRRHAGPRYSLAIFACSSALLLL